MSGGGPGGAGAGGLARSAKDQGQRAAACSVCRKVGGHEQQCPRLWVEQERAARPDEDPFTSAPWSKARGRFLEAVDEVTLWVRDRETQVPNTPGHETAERRLVDACANVCAAVLPAWATSEGIVAIRAERDAAVKSTEQARRERDAAERRRDAARSDLDNVRKKLWRAQACHEVAAGKYATAEANLRDSRDRIARLEEDLAEYQKATASKTAAEAQETIVRLAGRIDVGQAALEQATSERDAALRSWEALRDQLAAAEAATEQARAERDAAERDRAALRSRVADLEADVTAWQAATGCDQPERFGSARVDAGRTWLERAETRFVALKAQVSPENELSLAGIRVQCEELYAHIFREGGMGEQHADLLTRVDVLERGLATAAECRARLAARLSELERRTAPKPDALSKCEEPPAEPRVGEVWEDSEGGEQGRIVTRIEAADGPCWDAAVVKPSRGNHHSPIGARIVVSGPPRWHRVPSEQDARAALREEVAALCEAAGWPGCAAGIRSGNAARIYLQPRPAATTEATRNALAALDALAEAERPLAALWEHVAVLCERATCRGFGERSPGATPRRIG